MNIHIVLSYNSFRTINTFSREIYNGTITLSSLLVEIMN